MKKLAFLSIILLFACTKTPNQEVNIELSVDGKPVIQERATDEKTEKLKESRLKILEIIQQACNFSKFLNENISARAPEASATSSISSKTSTSRESSSNFNVSSISTTVIQPISLPGKIIECAPNMDGCTLRDSSEGSKQVQYTLLLRDFLKEKYNMQQQSIWRYELTIRTDKPVSFTQGIREMVAISDSKLLCESQVTQEEK